jgi:DNA-binding beta-propeller fold protein YncE
MLNILKNYLFILVFLFLVACGDPIVEHQAPLVSSNVFIINSLDDTLSSLNIASGEVRNNLAKLGNSPSGKNYPNDLVIKDSTAYVVNSGDNSIQAINLDTMLTEYFISLGAGSNPYAMAFSGNNKIYVTNLISNNIASIDLNNKEIKKNISLPENMSSPEGIVALNDKAYVAITNYDFSLGAYNSGAVVVIDTKADTIIKTINLSGLNPQNLAISYDTDEIFVVCTGDYFNTPGKVEVIDTITDTITKIIDIGGMPGSISLSPNQNAYVADLSGNLWAFNITTKDILYGANTLDLSQKIFQISGFVSNLVIDGDNKAYILSFGEDKIYIMDTNNNNVIGSYTVGDGPIDLDLRY